MTPKYPEPVIETLPDTELEESWKDFIAEIQKEVSDPNSTILEGTCPCCGQLLI